MRQLIFGALATSTILAIGSAAYALQAGQYRNIPGAVTGSYAAGIKGTFQVVPTAAPGGLPSLPSGGACIIFRAKDLGFKRMWDKVCNVDDDCSVTGENSVGYCHLPSHKCWSKPVDWPSAPPNGSDKALCLRSIPGSSFSPPITPNVTIQISATPAQISTPSWKIRHNAKARVVTRLNCLGGAACAPDGRTFIHEWGPTTQL